MTDTQLARPQTARPRRSRSTAWSKKQPRYIYGKDSNGCDDYWIVQDSKTKRDLCCSLFWDCEPAWAERTEADIRLIVDALNTYRPACDRKAQLGEADSPMPVTFDGYEVHGVRRFGRGKERYCERVPDEEARFWSIYGHIPGEGFTCIGDFKSRSVAEEVYARITGRPYGQDESFNFFMKGINDMTDEPTNADRAAWAKEALAVFTARTFSGDHPDSMDRDDLESAVGDLVADLLHFATQQGFSTGDTVRRALGNFGAELLEEATRSGKAAPALREALAWVATAAEDLDAAIVGVTDQFDSERVELHSACCHARQVLGECTDGQSNRPDAGHSDSMGG
jgi:hypothetical protein